MSKQEQTSTLINELSHRWTAAYVDEAQKLHDGGLPATIATGIVLDAALMAAASFIQTAVFNGAVRTTIPVDDLLRIRLAELLAMEKRIFPRLPDGSFDPVGMARN